MLKEKILIVLVAQILQTSSISLEPKPSKIFRPKKLDKSAFLQIIKNGPAQFLWTPPTGNITVKDDSVFQRLSKEYGKLQHTFYSESRELSGGVKDGIDEVISHCHYCETTVLGKERTRCYASCMTHEMRTFAPYSLLIGDTVQNLYCVPLGFGFETQYKTPMVMHPIWFWSFPEFVKQFNENNETFSTSSLTETWMSNLLWLDKSPLHLHSYIRSQVALNIANLQNGSNSNTNTEVARYAWQLTGLETPQTFAAKCGTQWDLRNPVYSLIHAVREKSHFLDVILRGFFTVRSAAFYTLGNFQNLAGGIVEALGALIGTKCGIISYSKGESVSDDTCDGIGQYPIPQFPTPMIFSKLLQPCK